ncbi:hypothetical protein BB561_001573 [Smittium simulii]|uniref:UBA domain-containing protein n=1 Tax=Smittium simulii TaxID=133385 RepID=A0A2T9YTY4_9FUNG|nr:hypothetical protein BB561_001573 [Smittium simulii]
MASNNSSLLDDFSHLVDLDNLSASQSPIPSSSSHNTINKPAITNRTFTAIQTPPSYSHASIQNTLSPFSSFQGSSQLNPFSVSHSNSPLLQNNTNTSQNISSHTNSLNSSLNSSKNDVFAELLEITQKSKPSPSPQYPLSSQSLRTFDSSQNSSSIQHNTAAAKQPPHVSNPTWDFDLLPGSSISTSKNKLNSFANNSASSTNKANLDLFDLPSQQSSTSLLSFEPNSRAQTISKTHNSNSQKVDLALNNKPSLLENDHKLATIIQRGYTLDQAQDALLISDNHVDAALKLLQEQTSLPVSSLNIPNSTHIPHINKQFNHQHVHKNTSSSPNSEDSNYIYHNYNGNKSNSIKNSDLTHKTMETTEKIFSTVNQVGSNILKQASGWFESNIVAVKKSYSRMSSQNQNWNPNSSKWSPSQNDNDAYKDSSSDESVDNSFSSHFNNPDKASISNPAYTPNSTFSKKNNHHFQNQPKNSYLNNRHDLRSENFVETPDTGDLLDGLDIDTSSNNILRSNYHQNITNDQDLLSDKFSNSIKIDTNKQNLNRPAIINTQNKSSSKVDTFKLAEIPQSLFASINKNKNDANSLFKLGQHEEACVGYSKAIELAQQVNSAHHPYISLLLNNRAACYFKMGDLKSCLSDSLRASEISKPFIGSSSLFLNSERIDLDAQYKKAIIRIGTCYENLEKYNEALTNYSLLLQLKLDSNLRAQAINGTYRCEKSLGRKPTVSQYVNKPTDNNTLNSKSFTQSYNSNPQPHKQSKSNANAQRNTELSKIEENAFLEMRYAIQEKVKLWVGNNKSNLRALLGNLHQIYPKLPQINLSDLVEDKKVKLFYMKTVSKLHPDKKILHDSVEDTILKCELFTVLSDAWAIFNQQKM